MNEASILTHLSQSLVLFMIWVLPPLLAALISGLIIGLIQAAARSAGLGPEHALG
jgi:type III secretion protein S